MGRIPARPGDPAQHGKLRSLSDGNASSTRFPARSENPGDSCQPGFHRCRGVGNRLHAARLPRAGVLRSPGLPSTIRRCRQAGVPSPLTQYLIVPWRQVTRRRGRRWANRASAAPGTRSATEPDRFTWFHRSTHSIAKTLLQRKSRQNSEGQDTSAAVFSRPDVSCPSRRADGRRFRRNANSLLVPGLRHVDQLTAALAGSAAQLAGRLGRRLRGWIRGRRRPLPLPPSSSPDACGSGRSCGPPHRREGS